MHLNTFQQPFRGLQINRTHPLAKNLIGYWPCNDGTGKKVWDYSGNANQGTLEGTAPTWRGGQRGYAVNFPGTNERIDCGNNSPLDQIGNGSFWISFRMKSKDVVPLNFGMLFSKGADTGLNLLFLSSGGTNNRLNLFFKKGGVGISNTLFSVNTTPFDTIRNHIVLVINRITDLALVYINTIKDTTEIDISSVPADGSNAGDVLWGRRLDGFSYEGDLNEMQIHTGAPTQEIINWLYWEPYAIFKTWRRRYQFFPDRIFLNIVGKTTGLIFNEAAPGVTITGDRG